MALNTWPLLGCGVGLRTQHYARVTEEWPKMDWFEAVTENFMDSGGRPIRVLEEVRAHYPVALHGVSLSVGSADPLDCRYLERLKALADRIDPAIVSDHLCWTGVEGENLHDLLPLPFTEEAVEYLAARIRQVQDAIGRRILVENVSTYVTYKHSTLPEWEFLTAVARRADCGILLDLNNVYVNSKNHGFDPADYVRGVPGELVGQFHLAGHTDMGDFLFDTHSAEIVSPVWDLYREALRLYGQVTTLIEWDEAVPEFGRLAAEADKAREIYKRFPARKTGAPQAPPPLFAGQGGAARTASEAPASMREAQKLFKSALRDATHADVKKVSGTFHIARPERISVYSNGYVARLNEALSEVFEAVRHLVGHDVFTDLVEDYATVYPSHDYNLNNVGRHLPEFLKTGRFTEKLGFLPDLAALEWQVCRSFHAFDEKPFELASLKAASEEDWSHLRLTFQPSLGLVESTWPILDLWNARRAPLSGLKIDLVGRPQRVLVWRQGTDIRCELLDPLQHRLLSELLSRRTLGEACEAIAESMSDDEALNVREWFAAWSSRGLIRQGGFAAVPR